MVEDALSPDTIRELLAGVDAGTANHSPTEGKSASDGSSRRYSGILNWGDAFVHLVGNPKVLPLLHGALGADAMLDHEYAHCLEPNAEGTPVVRGQIHGGPGRTGQPPGVRSRNLATMISCVYDLVDAAPEDGGFGAVAGSHKAMYHLPISPKVDPVSRQYPALVTRLPCRGTSTAHPPQQSCTLPLTDAPRAVAAGCCIVFTERMAHCSLPWTGKRERKTLFCEIFPAAAIHLPPNLTRAWSCQISTPVETAASRQTSPIRTAPECGGL